MKLNENFIIFRIRFESYKYLVLFFELINNSTTFQNFINDTLMNYFNKFVVIYLNDIFIYNDNIQKYKKHYEIFFKSFKKLTFKQTSTNANFTKPKRNF